MSTISEVVNEILDRLDNMVAKTHLFKVAGIGGAECYCIVYISAEVFAKTNLHVPLNIKTISDFGIENRYVHLEPSIDPEYLLDLALRTKETDKIHSQFVTRVGFGDGCIDAVTGEIFEFLVNGIYPTNTGKLH
jgi:hypothetical protein